MTMEGENEMINEALDQLILMGVLGIVLIYWHYGGPIPVLPLPVYCDVHDSAGVYRRLSGTVFDGTGSQCGGHGGIYQPPVTVVVGQTMESCWWII